MDGTNQKGDFDQKSDVYLQAARAGGNTKGKGLPAALGSRHAIPDKEGGGWILDTMQHRRNGMIRALEPSGTRRGAGDSVHDGSGL